MLRFYENAHETPKSEGMKTMLTRWRASNQAVSGGRDSPPVGPIASLRIENGPRSNDTQTLNRISRRGHCATRYHTGPLVESTHVADFYYILVRGRLIGAVRRSGSK